MLTIKKTAGNIWTHNVTGISKGYVKWNTSTEKFMLFAENGQAPIQTYEVSEITLIDDTTTTTYPTFTTVLALVTQLKSLSYVGFPSEGGAVGSLNDLTDVTIASPSNNQVLKYNSTTSLWENGAAISQDTTGAIIPISFADCTSNFSTLLHNSYTAKVGHFDFENYNNDAWVSGNGINTNQRLTYMFGGNSFPLKSIYYLNGFSNVNSLTILNSNRGIQNCVIYAITANVTPTTTYGVTTGDFQSIYSGTLTQQTTVSLLSSVILTTPVDCYGFVIDAADAYGGTLMSIRRVIAKQ